MTLRPSMNADERREFLADAVLLTLTETRTLLRISRTKVWELIRHREIVAFKIGGTTRVAASSVEAYLKRCRIDPDELPTHEDEE